MTTRYRCTFDRDERGRTRTNFLLDGERVSGLAMWDMPVRIGSCEVRLAGIGGVWTHEHHRKKGYASIVMTDSVAWMRENGFDISMLFGIPDFYWRWGFISTVASTTVEVPTPHAESVKRTSRPRRFRTRDLARAIRIFNRDNARRTGSTVRRKSTWIPWRIGLEWREPPEIWLYAARGRTVGTAGWCLKPDAVQCCEVSAVDASAFGGILRHAADLAVRRRASSVVFHVPRDHPFTDFCRDQGCRVSTQVPRAGGGMARIINQRTCLEKIAPELTQRLHESTLADWSGTVAIVTDLETTRLVVKRGVVRIDGDKGRGRADVRLDLPQQRLTQLLFGFQPVSHLLSQTPTKLTGDTSGVVEALFPRQEATVWQSDRF
ncbi:MAG TPA: GNAT family N-acetyltransferase [Planctomycetota bacterium]|nr:GNAT family N-acetyltransferase [Planctomycetota bacterium]